MVQGKGKWATKIMAYFSFSIISVQRFTIFQICVLKNNLTIVVIGLYATIPYNNSRTQISKSIIFKRTMIEAAEKWTIKLVSSLHSSPSVAYTSVMILKAPIIFPTQAWERDRKDIYQLP
jgi:hypothetical protein